MHTRYLGSTFRDRILGCSTFDPPGWECLIFLRDGLTTTAGVVTWSTPTSREVIAACSGNYN